MKRLIPFLLLAVCALSFAQDQGGMMDMRPPKELKAAEFLLGRWSGRETFYENGKGTSGRATITCTKEMNGRFLHGMHTSSMGGDSMKGLHLLSYDPQIKKYRAYWFDSASSEAMELTGTLTGNKLIMVSKPTDVPGMPGVVFRSTWTRKSPRALGMVLDMQMGGKWVKVIDGNYPKR
jgi:hypothetical protein